MKFYIENFEDENSKAQIPKHSASIMNKTYEV